MPPAARVTDDHTCPLANGDGSLHKGGPILDGPTPPNVFIGGQAAATVGYPCFCVEVLDQIALGSQTVKINNQGAARQFDSTAHLGGLITGGCETVIIGG